MKPGVGGVEKTGAVDDHLTDPPETVSSSPTIFLSPLHLSPRSSRVRVPHWWPHPWKRASGRYSAFCRAVACSILTQCEIRNPSWVIVSTLARLKEVCKESFARVGLSLPSSASVLRSPGSVSIPHRNQHRPTLATSRCVSGRRARHFSAIAHERPSA